MTGQRSAVQNSSVRSAYCPPPALVAAVSAAMPAWFTAFEVGGEQAVASSRWLVRQSGTIELRIRDRPEDQHLRAGAAQLLYQAVQAVDPRRVV